MDVSESYERSASTPSSWKRTKITGRRRRPRAQPAKQPALSVWPRRNGLTVTIKARGGAESWWEIRARGRHWRFPGWVAFEDVMTWILQEDPSAPGRGDRPG